MDELEQKIESLKLLQDWSKWLIGLEAGVCVLLWRGFEAKPPISVYLAWLMFWLSILAASFLLIRISFVVRYPQDTLEQNVKKLWRFVVAEYGFFFLGMIFLAWRFFQLWPHIAQKAPDCT